LVASENSFDIVSKIDLQEVDNAVQQALKEIHQRYDFKGSISDIRREKEVLHLVADDEFKLKAVTEILLQKLAARHVPAKGLTFSPRSGHRHGWRARRIAGAAALLSVLLLPAAALADEEEGRVSIHGRIIDGTGTGVAGQVVRLLKSRTYLKVGGLRSLDQSVEDARATTDALGFFEIGTRRDTAFPYYYLRFYDPKTFDAVQYRLPEDREISKKVRFGRPVQISVSLQFQPDWPKCK